MKRRSLFAVFATIIFSFALASTLAAFAASSSTKADTQDFYFESFDAEYHLFKTQTGSSLRVKETLVAYFPNDSVNHGIDRCIPETYKGKDVLVHQINGIPIHVDGGERQKNSALINSDEFYTTYASGDYTCYRIGDKNEYVVGRHTYVLEYEYRDIIIAPADSAFEELYWDTNGVNWKQPFRSLSATVTFDDELLPVLQNSPSCYVGKAGAKGLDRCKITKLTNGYTFETFDLKAKENLSFDFEFPKGTFRNVIILEYNYTFIFLILIVVILLLIPIIIRLVKYSKTRDKRDIINGACPPQYLPPADLAPASAARLFYYHSNMKSRDFVATIIDLAVRKKIHFKKDNVGELKLVVPADRKGFESFAEHALTVLNCGETMPGSRTYGSTSLPDAVIDISASKRPPRKKRYKVENAARSFRNDIARTLYHAGYFRCATDTKQPSLTAKEVIKRLFIYLVLSPLLPFVLLATPVGFVSLAIIAIIGAVFFETPLHRLFEDPTAIYVGRNIFFWIILVFVLATLLICSRLKHRTEELDIITKKGAEEIRYLKGLRDYMALAEADRLKFLQSVDGADTTREGIIKLYEKLLPYAVIFDVEESWFAELKKFYKDIDLDDSFLDSLDFNTFSSVSVGVALSSSNAVSSLISSGFGDALESFGDHLGGFASGGDGGGSSGSGGGGGGGSGGGGGGGGGGGW